MYKQRGFTLIELLIAILLTMAVLSAGYSVFYGSSKATVMQTQLSRMQDNARMAMDVLARNFRRAGFGVNFSNYPAGIVIRPANPPITYDGVTSEKLRHENHTDAPDAVTIVGGWQGWKTRFERTALAQASQIKVVDASMIQAGDVIGIGLTHSAPVGAIAGTVLTLNDTIQHARLNMKYYGDLNELGNPEVDENNFTRSGEMVVKVEANRFEIVSEVFSTGSIPVLKQDGQPVAEGIEDMQFEYGVDTNDDKIIQDAEWTHTPDQVSFGGAVSDMREKIRLVRITIVARTDNPDPVLVGSTRTVPAIADRAARDVTDGYRRLVLTRMVKCRNMDILPTL